MEASHQVGVVVPSTPVFDLPEELMYNIFLDVCKNNILQTLKLCLVCKRWRKSILDASVLWSNIQFKSPPPYHFQERLLQRSKSAPLSITIDKIGCYVTGMRAIAMVIKLLRPHVHRFGSLNIISMKAKGVRTFFDELGHIKAPMLERLVVQQPVDAKKWILKPFGGHATRLLTLHVACGRTNWDLSLLCNLTSLTLSISSWRYTWHINVFYILTTLAQTPYLQTLNLQVELGHLAVGQTWIFTQIKLCHLTEINITSVNHYVYTSFAEEPWIAPLLCGIVAPNLHRFPYAIPPLRLAALNDCPIFPLPGLQELQMIPSHTNSQSELALSRDSFPTLVKNLHQIRKLYLLGDQLNEIALQTLSTRLPYLDTLDITGFPPSIEGLNSMILARANNPDLSYLTSCAGSLF